MRIFSLISALWLLNISSALACAPAMHAHLATLWLDMHQVEDEDDRKAFLLGALFPDIRYLGKVSRAQTHPANPSLKKIDQTTPYFEKGQILHSYIDQQYAVYSKKKKVYAHPTLAVLAKRPKKLFVELVMDEILHTKLDELEARQYLATTIKDEQRYDLNQFDIYQWHMVLGLYFSGAPSAHLNKLAFIERGVLHLDAETIELWHELMPKQREEPFFQAYVSDFIDLFRRQFAEHH